MITKLILSIFTNVTHLTFELGFIALMWLTWGWQVGVATLLWYILWIWMGITLLNIHEAEHEQASREFLKNYAESLGEYFKSISKINKDDTDDKTKDKE